MHYLVTGATGFLGGHVTVGLLADGHTVTALVPTHDVAREIAPYGVRPHVGSVMDAASMAGVMRGVDGVFHLAGHRMGFADRALAEAIIVGGTRNVLDVAAQMGVPRVVCTSTLAAMSDTGGVVIDETHRPPGGRLTDHDRMWARVHENELAPAMEAGAPVLVVMTGAVYGPGDSSGMAHLLRRYLRGRVPAVPARPAYCWAHVEDSARGHVLAMESGRSGETYIIGGEPDTVRGVLARVGDLVGRPHPPVPVPGWAAGVPRMVVRPLSRIIPGLVPMADRLRLAGGATYLGSDAKARHELGWSRRSLDEGLPGYVEWLLREMILTA